MSFFKIKSGITIIADSDSSLFIMDETGRKKATSALYSELIGLIHKDFGDEEGLVVALEDRFPLDQIYYALIQLENRGVIVKAAELPESSTDLFRAKVHGQDQIGYPRPRSSEIVVRIFATNGMDSSAESLAVSLSRSDVLNAEAVSDWHSMKRDNDAVYVMVTADYLEPELEVFGRFAYEHRLRWLPVKLCGVVSWMGPLFITGETGCVACLLERVRGHRRLEVKQISKDGRKQSLCLSVGETIHSFETVAGLLAVELEKLAAGDIPEIVGGVFTLDFRMLDLKRHPFIKRPQCPVCGALISKTNLTGTIPEKPLQLQSRAKADYRDGGERVCSAAETLDKYAHLIGPVTGIVGKLTVLEEIPLCFGQVIKSDWIVRDAGETAGSTDNGRFSVTGLSTGKGRTIPQARASALGEAIERYCSQYEGYEPHAHASFVELGETAIHPHDLMGFSERQYTNRDMWRKKGSTVYVPDPYDVVRKIDWTPAWSLTQQRWRLVPSSSVYYSYPRQNGGDICRGCSNGVAAGNCLEEAVMQGFFELVERDAVAMWWYHRLQRPAVDWRSFDSPFVAACYVAMEKMDMKLEVLDLTNDLGFPVFSANLFNCNGDYRFKSIGLGCHRDPHIALERAVSELGQSWRLADRDEYSLKFQNSPHSRELFLRADPGQTPKTSSDFGREWFDNFLEDIEDVVDLLRMRKLEILVVDLTRPDIGFPVVRVIVPGMVHFWPRFSCRRLFEVPKAAGWIDKDAGEDDLNPVPFFL